MRRFVTYIYEYERGNRGRNVGFIRTDIRDDGCRMEVHIRMGDRTDQKGAIFLVADAQNPVGVPAGELLLVQGMGHLRLTCPQNRLGKSGYSVSQLLAFVVRLGNRQMLVGSFASDPPEAVLRGEFEVWKPEPTPQPKPAPQPESAPQPRPAPQLKPAPQPQPTLLQQAEPDPTVTCEHIEIADIRKLPKRNWYLCNNSFLVHGFFNYHYLILKTVKQDGQVQRFLGVPGIYEQRERMMALLFGFPEFEAAQPGDAAGANESFGYWMCPVSES